MAGQGGRRSKGGTHTGKKCVQDGNAVNSDGPAVMAGGIPKNTAQAAIRAALAMDCRTAGNALDSTIAEYIEHVAVSVLRSGVPRTELSVALGGVLADWDTSRIESLCDTCWTAAMKAAAKGGTQAVSSDNNIEVVEQINRAREIIADHVAAELAQEEAVSEKKKQKRLRQKEKKKLAKKGHQQQVDAATSSVTNSDSESDGESNTAIAQQEAGMEEESNKCDQLEDSEAWIVKSYSEGVELTYDVQTDGDGVIKSMQVVSRQCQNEALRKKDDQVSLTLSDSTDPSGSKRTPLSALSPRSFRDHCAESPEIASRDDRIPKEEDSVEEEKKDSAALESPVAVPRGAMYSAIRPFDATTDGPQNSENTGGLDLFICDVVEEETDLDMEAFGPPPLLLPPSESPGAAHRGRPGRPPHPETLHKMAARRSNPQLPFGTIFNKSASGNPTHMGSDCRSLGSSPLMPHADPSVQARSVGNSPLMPHVDPQVFVPARAQSSPSRQAVQRRASSVPLNPAPGQTSSRSSLSSAGHLSHLLPRIESGVALSGMDDHSSASESDSLLSQPPSPMLWPSTPGSQRCSSPDICWTSTPDFSPQIGSALPPQAPIPPVGYGGGMPPQIVYVPIMVPHICHHCGRDCIPNFGKEPGLTPQCSTTSSRPASAFGTPPGLDVNPICGPSVSSSVVTSPSGSPAVGPIMGGPWGSLFSQVPAPSVAKDQM